MSHAPPVAQKDMVMEERSPTTVHWLPHSLPYGPRALRVLLCKEELLPNPPQDPGPHSEEHMLFVNTLPIM